MKITRLGAALPLFAALLMSAPAVEVVLPEQLFPQLDGILKKAVQQSPKMLNQALSLEMADAARVSARSSMLPSVSGYITYQQARDRNSLINDTTGSSTVSNYDVNKIPFGISLSQPLYHWRSLENSAKIGEIQHNIAKGNYREAYRSLVYQLRADYLYLIVMKKSAQRAAYHLETLSAQAKQAEERLAKKIISEAAIFSVRINLERAQIAAEQTEFDLQMAVRSFTRLAGIGGEFSVSDIPDSIPQAAHNAEAINGTLAGFLSQKDPPSTEAANMRRQIEVEKLTYEINRKRLWPKLGLVVGMYQTEDDNYFGQGAKYKVTSSYVGLSMGWSIFDGFATQAAQRSSLARLRSQENDYRQVTERIAQDAQTQVKTAEFSARHMSISDRLLVSGEGSFKTKKDEFARGVSSEAQVSEAQLVLYDAQITAYLARRLYLLNVVTFLGTVLEDPVLANLPAQ